MVYEDIHKLNSCQGYPLSSMTSTADMVERGHLDRENDIDLNIQKQSIQSIKSFDAAFNIKHKKYKNLAFNSTEELNIEVNTNLFHGLQMNI